METGSELLVDDVVSTQTLHRRQVIPPPSSTTHPQVSESTSAPRHTGPATTRVNDRSYLGGRRTSAFESLLVAIDRSTPAKSVDYGLVHLFGTILTEPALLKLISMLMVMLQDFNPLLWPAVTIFVFAHFATTSPSLFGRIGGGMIMFMLLAVYGRIVSLTLYLVVMFLGFS